MGGNAFREYSTPRLPTSLYEHLRSQTIDVLQPFYTSVGSPVPGPGKLDHGDIDIIVTGAIGSLPEREEGPSRERTSALLGAVTYMEIGPTISYLVPLSPNEATVLPPGISPLHQHQDHFFQIDIHATPTLSTYNWLLFNHSHSDLFSLLGTAIRPFGLTITDTAVFIRSAEIEAAGQGRRARIFVTDSPRRCWEDVLGFPDWETYYSPQRWPTLEAMYAFITQCRFFMFSEFEQGRSLNSGERQRMKSRPAYRGFVEEYVPELLRVEPDFGERGKGLTREMVWQEVMEGFQGVKEEANRKLKLWREEEGRIRVNKERRAMNKMTADEEGR